MACFLGHTVYDKEYQVQPMQFIVVDESNQSALILMKNLRENYGVTWRKGSLGFRYAVPQDSTYKLYRSRSVRDNCNEKSMPEDLNRQLRWDGSINIDSTTFAANQYA